MRPTETILAEVGFTISDIARVTGRPYEAVKMRLRRAAIVFAGKARTRIVLNQYLTRLQRSQRTQGQVDKSHLESELE